MTVSIRRGRERFRTESPGVVSFHSFSAGPHYDPANLALGPLLGYDEHLVSPGAGFGWHAHRGVDIVTWVIEGTLTHEDSLQDTVMLHAGDLAAMHAGSGVRHVERNDGDRPVRFTQATVLGAVVAPHYVVFKPPADVGSSHFTVLASGTHRMTLGGAQLVHLFVARGQAFVGAGEILEAGDALRAVGATTVRVTVAPGASVQAWTTTGAPEPSP